MLFGEPQVPLVRALALYGAAPRVHNSDAGRGG
jgi:hypothetical protein